MGAAAATTLHVCVWTKNRNKLIFDFINYFLLFIHFINSALTFATFIVHTYTRCSYCIYRSCCWMNFKNSIPTWFEAVKYYWIFRLKNIRNDINKFLFLCWTETLEKWRSACFRFVIPSTLFSYSILLAMQIIQLLWVYFNLNLFPTLQRNILISSVCLTEHSMSSPTHILIWSLIFFSPSHFGFVASCLGSANIHDKQKEQKWFWNVSVSDRSW